MNQIFAYLKLNFDIGVKNGWKHKDKHKNKKGLLYLFICKCSFLSVFSYWHNYHVIDSVQGVFNWESNWSSTVEVEAVLHHLAIVVVPEEAPSSNIVASHGGTEGLTVDEVVPNPDGEVLNESSGGRSYHKGGKEKGGSNGLLLVLVHFLK